MVRLNLFKGKTKTENENSNNPNQPTETEIPIPPEPPKILDTRKVEKQEQPVVQYVEREVTLSLLNDKINYLTSRFEEFLTAISKEKEDDVK